MSVLNTVTLSTSQIVTKTPLEVTLHHNTMAKVHSVDAIRVITVKINATIMTLLQRHQEDAKYSSRAATAIQANSAAIL